MTPGEPHTGPGPYESMGPGLRLAAAANQGGSQPGGAAALGPGPGPMGSYGPRPTWGPLGIIP
jgi:hypothetical protein